MFKIRRASECGHFENDWLKSQHTFSFGDYYDPAFTHYASLRVLNDDIVKPAGGFATHAHNNMEIITYVLEGAIEHKDSLGNGSVIYPGEVQRMSAGSGIRHSEFNHSDIEPLRFLQIWFLPDQLGIPPEYQQQKFKQADRLNQFQRVLSGRYPEGIVTLHQDVDMYIAELTSPDVRLSHHIARGRKGWLYIAQGQVELAGETLKQGDSAALSEDYTLEVSNANSAELVLFDMLMVD